MISIIVPVYNAETSLNRCINSILNQSYKDFELILVDDGSKDGSGEICDDYASKNSRIRVFHKSNGGPSSARNIGLDEARGDWITFCDSDDYVYPNWLENFQVEKNINNQVDLICQGMLINSLCSRNDLRERSVRCGFEGDVLTAWDSLSSENAIGFLFIKAFRANIITQNNLRFCESFKYKEDEEFVVHYLSLIENTVGYNQIGYSYFEPDWDKKYHVPLKINEFWHQKCIDYLSVSNKHLKKLRTHYIESLVRLYINEFHFNSSNRRYCLKMLRRHINQYAEDCQQFKILGKILQYDRTYVMSYLFLLILKLRNAFLIK